MANENYEQNQGRVLERVLETCHWMRVRGKELRLWEMGRSRILVDHIGIFFYRNLGGSWVRTAGLAHNRICHLPDRFIKFDDFTIDLLTGD
jgi:hypothetical protein